MAETLTKRELDFFKRLSSPIKIQDFLDSLEYNPSNVSRSPRWVIRNKTAHCFEAAIFAAASLRQIGYRPLVMDLRSVNDDDHTLAIFRKNNCWGAIAKSNFTTLKYREPVYRTLRELAMSFFDFYFNTLGEKTLREYSVPLDLSRLDKRNWMTTEEEIDYIGEYLDKVRHFRVITQEMIKSLRMTDRLLLRSSLLGAKKEGLYRPKNLS